MLQPRLTYHGSKLESNDNPQLAQSAALPLVQCSCTRILGSPLSALAFSVMEPKVDAQYVQVQQVHHWALTTLPLLHPGILHMFLGVSSPQDGS